jgi:hypothetical protein
MVKQLSTSVLDVDMADSGESKKQSKKRKQPDPLNAEVLRLNREINATRKRHALEYETMKARHNEECRALSARHNAELSSMIQEFDNAMQKRRDGGRKQLATQADRKFKPM